MKELKVYVPQDGPYGLEPEEGGEPVEEETCYLKSDVDAAIDELKAEINHKEGVGLRWFERCMEARTENVKLKRALWLSRADRAMMTLDFLTLKCRFFKDYMKVEPPKCDVKMIHKWATVQRKCRAKMDEYK